MKTFPALLGVIFFSVSSTAHVSAQKPITAGDVAALIDEKPTEDSRNLLRQALGDSRPLVRGVAARVIGLGSHHDSYPVLLEALGRENDSFAAGEQVRAALFLRGREAAAAARTAAERLGSDPLLILAEWRARRDPGQFAELADLFPKVPLPLQPNLGRLGATAAPDPAADRERLNLALAKHGGPYGWRYYLRSVDRDFDGAAARAGLRSPDPRVREETIWWILTSVARGRSFDAAMVDEAAGAGIEGQETEWASVGRELLGRRLHKKSPVDVSPLLERLTPLHRDDAAALGLVQILAPAEQAALKKGLGDVPLEKPSTTPAPNASDTTKPATGLRMLPSLAPGFLGELFEATQCSYGDAYAIGAARITYQTDGRPKQIGFDAGNLTAGCAKMLRIAALLTIAESYQPLPIDMQQWLFVPTEKSVIACADAPPSSEQPRYVGGKLTPPRKTRNVEPRYPDLAQKAGVQGLVIVEGTISATGCVNQATVIRSVHPALDISAMQAVSQWRFTPTLIDGVAVPVIMTITINFALR